MDVDLPLNLEALEKMMKIHGFNTLTLLDYPCHLAATLFLGGCNYRCPFCQNAGLVISPEKEPYIEEEEVLSHLRKRKGLLDGVCVTGGEPTLYNELPEFMAKLKDLGYLVKLDTNGTRPKMLKTLRQQGLIDYVAMDIKTSRQNYGRVSGRLNQDITPVLESAAYLMSCGMEYEFRTTVVKELHSAEDFADIGSWLAGCSYYYLQSYRDSENVIQPGFHSYSKEELEGFQHILKASIPQVALRGIDT